MYCVSLIVYSDLRSKSVIKLEYFSQWLFSRLQTSAPNELARRSAYVSLLSFDLLPVPAKL